MTGKVGMSWSYNFPGKCVCNTNYLQVKISSEKVLEMWKGPPQQDTYKTQKEKKKTMRFIESLTKASSRSPEDKQHKSAPLVQHEARAADGTAINERARRTLGREGATVSTKG